MDEDRLVEVYSARDAIEAYGLRNLLEIEGIHAEVVGADLVFAAGGLPVGRTIAPRIWVWAREAERAREIIRIVSGPAARAAPDALDALEAESEASAEPPAAAGGYAPEQPGPLEGETPSDEAAASEEASAESTDRPEPETGGGFNPVSAAMSGAAVACVLWGTWVAWENAIALATHSATATGQLVDGRFSLLSAVPTPDMWDRNIPWPFRRPFSYRSTHWRFAMNLEYEYEVAGWWYGATLLDAPGIADTVTIHYDPDHPEKHIVGPLMPPWLALTMAAALAALLALVGYQFR